MITVTKQSNSVLFEFENNPHYLQQGTMEVPFNSLILVEDESDMITFRKASTNDILFSAMYTEFSSLGDTKDDVVSALEDMMFAEGGGGGGVDPEDVVEIVESALTDYWTSAQTQSAINQASSGKQDTLVSGTNIKTINNQSLLGSGNINISGGSGSSYVYYSEDTEAKSATIHIEDADNGTVGELFVDGSSVDMYASGAVEEKGSTIETYTDISNNPEGIAISYGKNTGDETTDAHSYLYVNEGTISMQVYVEGGENRFEIGDGGVLANGEQVVTESQLNDYQPLLSAGTGIDITDNVISATGGGSSNIVELTQAQYDALVSGGTVDPSALYIITDASEVNLSGYAESSAVTAEISAAVSGKADSSAVTQSLSSKQDTLVSGTNIKTINNESLLGSGNIDIQGGGGATYSAGTNISIDSANTINCTLPITITDRGGNIIMVRGGGTGSNTFGTNTNNSFVFGSSNKINQGGVSKNSVCVFGNNNTSKNSYGITVGARLTSNNDYESSFGQYNVSNYVSGNFGNSGNTILSIGNGYNSYTHNAFEIRQNGDIYFPDTDNTSYANFYQKPMVRLQDMYAALGGLKFVSLTQSEYDQLATKDSATIYFIKDNSN